MKITDGFINKAKLCAPAISPHTIIRRNLLKKLQQITQYRLTLITASAGSGKTTAVRACLPALECKCAWLSIDECDNDPIRFWKGVIVSLSEILTNSGITDMPVNMEVITSHILLDELINRLYDYAEHLVYVFDDYHLVHNPLIKEGMAYSLKYLPANVSIVIISREGQEELDHLYVHGQGLRISDRDLSFTHEEIAEFFSQQNLELTSEELSAVENYTEGWAAGLVVIALSLTEGHKVSSLCAPPTALNHHIDRFLENEVFTKWPDEIKTFLVETSFLERLSGPLCRKVTCNEDSSEILRSLSETNGFIIALDRTHEWYRYHHLFREFLRNRLTGLGEPYAAGLHRSAAQWYEENGYIQDAIRNYLLSNSFDKAVSLVVSVCNQMAQSGEHYTICQWYDTIPEEYIMKHVTACTGYSWILSMVGRVDDALKWGDKAEEAFEMCRDGLDEAQKNFLKADIALAKANAAIRVMRVREACDLLKEACRYKMPRKIMSGELNPGEASLLKTDYCCKGMIRRSAEAYTGILKAGQKLLGDYSCYFTILWAEILYERNDLEAAYEAILKEIGRVIDLNIPGLIVPCFLTLAKIRFAEGDTKGAFQALKEGKLQLTGDKAIFWRRFFHAYAVRLHLAMKDTEAAEQRWGKRHMGVFDSLSTFQESEYQSFARLLLAQGKFKDALILLNRLEYFAYKERRFHSRVEILCLLSVVYLEIRNTEKAMGTLNEALELGVGEGYVRTFIDEGEPMSKLLGQYIRWKKRSGTDEKYGYAKSLLRLVNGNRPKYKDENAGREKAHLTAREKEVLQLMTQGRSNEEIAKELCVSVNTVKYHASNIYGKLGAKNRLEAVKEALLQKIGE